MRTTHQSVARISIARCALVGLLVSTLLGGIRFPIGEFIFNPERIALFVSVPVVTYLLLARISKIDVLLIAVLGIFLTLTIFDGGDNLLPRYLIYAGPMLFAVIASRISISRDAYEAFLLKGVLSIFLVCVGFYLIGEDVVPFMFEESNDRFKFLLFEPNIYGAFIAYLLVVAIPVIRFTPLGIVTAIAGAIALLISFSKGPIIAVVLSALLYPLISKRMSGLGLMLFYIFSMLVGSVVVVVLLNSDWYQAHLARQDAISARSLLFMAGIKEFLEHPLVGCGPVSFANTHKDLLEDLGTDNEKNLWLGQFQIAYLHDFGIIGWIAIHVLLIAGISRAFRNREDRFRSGLICGFLAIYIASQVTSTHTTGFFWTAFGLLSLRLVESRRYVTQAFQMSSR